MKLPIVIASLLAATFAFGQTEAPKLIQLAEGQAVIVPETTSKDGSYAVGYMMTPPAGVPAENWARIKDGTVFNDLPVKNLDTYSLDNVVIDLAAKKVAAKLAFDEPYFSYAGGSLNHGGLTTTYSPAKNGQRFVVVRSDGKWTQRDLAIVQLNADGGKLLDLLAVLQPAVYKKLGKEDVTLNFDKGKFTAPDTLVITYDDTTPKSEVEGKGGVVTLKLTPGKEGPKVVVTSVKIGR